MRVTVHGSPPPIPRGHRAARFPTPGILIAAAGVVLTLVVARAAIAGRLPLPGCTFKAWTGAACPSCGATRSLAALARFDFGAAFGWNPLIAAAALSILAAAVVWTLDRVAFDGRFARIAARWLRWGKAAKWTLGLLVLINWIYLWRTIP